ncbi:MAG: nucleotidyltransferase family protein [Bryobacteraceae bacterium]|nr:nucleotidyltransferase family protein [Bryobacteraceae bacterium]
MTLTGIILAGGASRRMGSPKALLPIGEETFLDRLIGALLPHCAPVIVVVGAHVDAIRRGAARATEVQFVANPDPERGQLSSLQCGLTAAPPDAEAVMFTPVDYPLVLPSTIAALARALDDASPHASVIVPVHDGKRGHPVCVRRELIAALLALPPEATARDVIRANEDRTLRIEVNDPGILRDIDDPEAYRALVGGAIRS